MPKKAQVAFVYPTPEILAEFDREQKRTEQLADLSIMLATIQGEVDAVDKFERMKATMQKTHNFSIENPAFLYYDDRTIGHGPGERFKSNGTLVTYLFPITEQDRSRFPEALGDAYGVHKTLDILVGPTFNLVATRAEYENLRAQVSEAAVEIEQVP